MSRISIEVTPEQHKRLKASAALAGKSIKEYVLEKVFSPVPEIDAEALQKLEEFVKARVESAKIGNISKRSPREIFEQVKTELST